MEKFINPPVQGPGNGIGPTSTTPPIIFFDDFIGVNLFTAAAGDTTVWEIGLSETGGTAVGTNDRHGGWLKVGVSATTAKDQSIQTSNECFLFDASKDLYMETRVIIADNTGGYFFGFSPRDSVLTAALASASINFDALGFHSPEDDSTLFGVNCDGSNISAVTTGVDFVNATAITLAVEYSSSSDTMKWYTDGDLKLTQTGASTTLPNQEVALGCITTSKGTTGPGIEIDYFYVVMDR